LRAAHQIGSGRRQPGALFVELGNEGTAIAAIAPGFDPALGPKPKRCSAKAAWVLGSPAKLEPPSPAPELFARQLLQNLGRHRLLTERNQAAGYFHIDELDVNSPLRAGSARLRIMLDIEATDRRIVMVRNAVLALAAAAVITGVASTTASADWFGHRADIRADRRDIRSDRLDIQRDRADLRRDWRDLSWDLRYGSRANVARDLADIRRDRSDLRNDYRDLRRDRFDLFLDRHGR
jgi:hypothetical protein